MAKSTVTQFGKMRLSYMIILALLAGCAGEVAVRVYHALVGIVAGLGGRV